MRTSRATAITWISSAIVILAFGVLWLSGKYPSSFWPTYVPAACIVAPLVAGITAFVVNHAHGKLASLMAAVTPTVLVAGGLGSFLTVDGSIARVLIGGSAIGFASLYMAYWRGLGTTDGRFRTDDFSHLSFAAHVVAMFSVYVAVFGIMPYLPLPRPLVAALAGVIALITAAETLRRSSVQPKMLFPVAGTVALLMVQTTLGLAQLPTSGLVNAAIGAAVYAGCLHVSLVALVAVPSVKAIRRHAAFSIAAIILVLSTARWT